jgi:hypothetical protein
MHIYEVRPRKDHRGIDLISDAPPFGRSESAQLFEEGVSEAEHDQMRQASRLDEESDEPEP